MVKFQNAGFSVGGAKQVCCTGWWWAVVGRHAWGDWGQVLMMVWRDDVFPLKIWRKAFLGAWSAGQKFLQLFWHLRQTPPDNTTHIISKCSAYCKREKPAKVNGTFSSPVALCLSVLETFKGNVSFWAKKSQKTHVTFDDRLNSNHEVWRHETYMGMFVSSFSFPMWCS